MHIEPTRDAERYAMTWPGMPLGLSRDQARNFFEAHKKPKGYVIERFAYNPQTGQTDTVGYDRCQS